MLTSPTQSRTPPFCTLRTLSHLKRDIQILGMITGRVAPPAPLFPSFASLGTFSQPAARPFSVSGRGIASRTWHHNPHRLSALPPSNSDLLVLRGVGPVNAALLAGHQITSIERLQELYCSTMGRDKQELLRFLSVRLLAALFFS